MFKFIKDLFFSSNQKPSAEMVSVVFKVVESLNKKLDEAEKSKDVSLRDLLLIEIRQSYAEINKVVCKYPTTFNLSNISNFESAINKVEEETENLKRDLSLEPASTTPGEIQGENDKKILVDTINNYLRIINESISIACQSKNQETIKTRVDIAKKTLNEAIILARQYSLDVDGFDEADRTIKLIERSLESDDPHAVLSKLDVPIERVLSSPAREILKEATLLKRQKKYLEACEKLKEAYSSPGSEFLMIEERLRLPMYLLLAGKGDDGWQEMMRLRKKYTDYFSKLRIRSQIEIFCRKEGKNRSDDFVEPENNYDDVSIIKQTFPDWRNDNLITGMRFSATLMLNTPLRVLRRHGEIHKNKDKQPPQIALNPSEGVWVTMLDEQFKFLDQGATMFSCFGNIPCDGGDYLQFLISIREIVEQDASIEDRITALKELANSSRWKDFDGWSCGGKYSGYPRIIDYYFPFFFNKELRDADLDTPNRVATASDKEILSVKGIGPSTLKKLRKLCEEISEFRDSDRYINVSR